MLALCLQRQGLTGGIPGGGGLEPFGLRVGRRFEVAAGGGIMRDERRENQGSRMGGVPVFPPDTLAIILPEVTNDILAGTLVRRGFNSQPPFADEAGQAAHILIRLLRRAGIAVGNHVGKFEGTLKKGTLAAISGKMVTQVPESMRIRTPSSIMGVRGTRYRRPSPTVIVVAMESGPMLKLATLPRKGGSSRNCAKLRSSGVMPMGELVLEEVVWVMMVFWPLELMDVMLVTDGWKETDAEEGVEPGSFSVEATAATRW